MFFDNKNTDYAKQWLDKCYVKSTTAYSTIRVWVIKFCRNRTGSNYALLSMKVTRGTNARNHSEISWNIVEQTWNKISDLITSSVFYTSIEETSTEKIEGKILESNASSASFCINIQFYRALLNGLDVDIKVIPTTFQPIFYTRFTNITKREMPPMCGKKYFTTLNFFFFCLENINFFLIKNLKPKLAFIFIKQW